MAEETKPLSAVHETADEIPEQFRPLYSERNGKWELTGVTGVKTQADVDRLSEALRKEKEDHKAAKERLRPWVDAGWKFDEIQTRMDKWEELELAAQNAGKMDDEKVNKLVEARVKPLIAPVEREKNLLAEQLKAATAEIETYRAREIQRTIYDAVDAAISKSNVVPSAREDVRLVAERMLEVDDEGRVITKDGVGVTPGVDVTVWLQEMQPKRQHWWPPSVGGGAQGSQVPGWQGIKNPWSAQHWNLTEQGKLVREDMTRAEQLARSAGSFIGASAPPKRAA